MALAKRTLVVIIVGVVVLIVGVIGGIVVGLSFFANGEIQTDAPIPDPGPMIDLGQFTSTLADREVHVVKLKITIELSSQELFTRIDGSGWIVTMKDEIIKTLKDQRYDNIRFTEGMEKLKQDIEVRLNAILPRHNGVAAVARVLFDEYMTQ
jgi:flagellar FliL protein